MTTMTVNYTREVSDSELYDLIFGTGALGMPWYADAKYSTADHSPEGDWTHVTFTAWDPNQEEGVFADFTATPAELVAAFQSAVDQDLILSTDSDARDAILDGLGYLDAAQSDLVIQLAIYGEVIFG